MIPKHLEAARSPGKFYFHNGCWWRYSKFNVPVQYKSIMMPIPWILENDRLYLENYRVHHPKLKNSIWMVDVVLRDQRYTNDEQCAEGFIPNRSLRVDAQAYLDEWNNHKRIAKTSWNNRCQECDGDGCDECDGLGVVDQYAPSDGDYMTVRWLLASEQTHGKKILDLIGQDEVDSYNRIRNIEYVADSITEGCYERW